MRKNVETAEVEDARTVLWSTATTALRSALHAEVLNQSFALNVMGWVKWEVNLDECKAEREMSLLLESGSSNRGRGKYLATG